MYRLLTETITDPAVIIGTILAFIIPFAVFRINTKLREIGGAPWKKESHHDKENRTKNKKRKR